MALTPGSRLGVYEVTAPIGEGGMGEVYRARDTKLNRDVALKVLPDAFAADPGRLARFEREAQTLASLNHPHIAAIYGLEESGGVSALVMELVEGEDLSQRIARGAVPLDEALPIARQIAEALEAAHDRGIIHRDLKPANVKVRLDGTVKVLDFGLAKAMEPLAAASASAPMSPTLTTPAMTQAGMILGTAAYMSPEQTRGKVVDKRADIWAFGCVLYEMLTGQRAFRGDDMSDVIASVLRDTPDLQALPETTPTTVRRLLDRCLERDPRLRLRDIGEARVVLSDSSTQDSMRNPTTDGATHVRRGRLALMPWFVAAAILIMAMGALVVWRGLPGARSAATGPIDSVVVLPFSNASGNSDGEYLSDGITDSVINSLAKLGKVRVVPRGVAFSYKGHMSDLPAIARALNVRAIVTGRVAERGDTLVVSAELMDVATISQTWGDQYTRKMADIFALQEDVARDIAKGLRLRLAGDDESKLAKRVTTDPEAYRLFLRGDFEWDKSTIPGWTSAIRFYQEAIDRDPQFAAPHVGVASSYLFLGAFGGLTQSDAFPKARTHVLRALQIDDTSGKAHDILASIKWLYDWDDTGAEAEFLRGHALDPNVDDFGYGIYLSSKGRDAESIGEMQRAVAANPGKTSTHVFLARALADAGRLEDGLREVLKYVDTGPNTRLLAGDIYFRLGRLAEAEAAYRKAAEVLHVPGAGLVAVHVRMGRPVDAERVFREAVALEGQGRLQAADIAQMCAALDRKDEAFRWLDKALGRRAAFLKTLRSMFLLNRLHSDPRWADLERRIATAGPPKE